MRPEPLVYVCFGGFVVLSLLSLLLGLLLRRMSFRVTDPAVAELARNGSWLLYGMAAVAGTAAVATLTLSVRSVLVFSVVGVVVVAVLCLLFVRAFARFARSRK